MPVRFLCPWRMSISALPTSHLAHITLVLLLEAQPTHRRHHSVFFTVVCPTRLRFARLHTLAAHGYAVVMVDGRGSANRGVAFESHLKDRLVRMTLIGQFYCRWSADWSVSLLVVSWLVGCNAGCQVIGQIYCWFDNQSTGDWPVLLLVVSWLVSFTVSCRLIGQFYCWWSDDCQFY